MKIYLGVIGLVVSIVLCCPAFAAYLESQTQLTDSSQREHSKAEFWGLDSSEWIRYQTLKSGVRTHLSVENISPLEVLGIHASSESERNRYARMWAQMVLEDTDRVLAFQRAFDEAMLNLTENEPLIDLAQLAPKSSVTERLNRSERLFLFVNVECEVCTALIPSVLASVPSRCPLDFYFLDEEVHLETPTIRNWLAKHEVTVESLAGIDVTFNRDLGLLSKLFPRLSHGPVLVSMSQKRFEIIDLATLL